MKKYVSRKGNRAAIVLMVSCAVFFFLGKLTNKKTPFLVSIALILAVGVIMLRINRCPYCGEGFRGLYWEKRTAGYCRKCGKLIEFDDFPRDDGG